MGGSVRCCYNTVQERQDHWEGILVPRVYMAIPWGTRSTSGQWRLNFLHPPSPVIHWYALLREVPNSYQISQRTQSTPINHLDSASPSLWTTHHPCMNHQRSSKAPENSQNHPKRVKQTASMPISEQPILTLYPFSSHPSLSIRSWFGSHGFSTGGAGFTLGPFTCGDFEPREAARAVEDVEATTAWVGGWWFNPVVKGSLEVKLPTRWRVEKQGREAEKRSRVRGN